LSANAVDPTHRRMSYEYDKADNKRFQTEDPGDLAHRARTLPPHELILGKPLSAARTDPRQAADVVARIRTGAARQAAVRRTN
jgi:hypothetical protein